MTYNQLLNKTVLTKTDPMDTIDVVFVGGYRATYSKLLVDEHMEDPETEKIIDNATGEIIYVKE